MPSQYDTETRARALALIRSGKPASHVAQDMGIPERTVQSWAVRLRQIAAEEGDRTLIDQDYAIAIRAGEMQLESMDQLEESGEPLYKYGGMLNFYRGTAIDKLLKRQQVGPAEPTQGPFIVYRETVVREVERHG